MFRDCKCRSMEPKARWESVGSCAEREILGEKIQFPRAVALCTSNRLMKSGMSEQLCNFDGDLKKTGVPSAELINLYRSFGEGGFGVIVTGCTMVSGTDIEAPGNVVLAKESASPERLKAMQQWTSETKKHGSIFIAQLFHPGKRSSDWAGGGKKFDPTTVSVAQLREFIDKFIYAGTYAETCGFNGVEIPCAYAFALGHLITEGRNTRTDEYGGSFENRTRALMEIIEGIRQQVKDNSKFVIGLKLNAHNLAPGYNDDDFRTFLQKAEKGVDYIVLTGGHYGLLKDATAHTESQTHLSPVDAAYKPMATALKTTLKNCKIYMNGGFVTVSDMIEAVQQGWTAGISLGRPAAAEPDLALKIMRGLVNGAMKSLIDPNDFPTSQEIAGTQLWQTGSKNRVMDSSNADHVKQFNECLKKHQEEVANSKQNPIIGWAKFVLP